LALLWLVASRHLPGGTLTSCPLVCACHLCEAAPLQSESCALVPLRVLVTSKRRRHLKWVLHCPLGVTLKWTLRCPVGVTLKWALRCLFGVT
jgi:hypothetical protein